MRTPEEIKAYKRQWYLDNKKRTKEHASIVKKAYREANNDKIKKQSREYHARTKDKAKLYYEANKIKITERVRKYRKDNLELLKQREKSYQIKKRKDPFYKLKDVVRNRIRAAVKSKGFTKNSKTATILGCTFEEFKIHIESLFESWMTWDNHGNPKDSIIEPNKTWDLDHIIPISSGITEDDVIKLNHYTNLQPLCTYVNRVIKRDN